MGVMRDMVSAALPAVPGALIRTVGRRYVAGKGQGDALRVVGSLHAEGVAATVDVLGEEVDEPGRAREAGDAYLELIASLPRSGPDVTLSVKPTLMGLRIGEQVALENMDRVFAAAASRDVLVQIDMEDHTTTSATLRLYNELLARRGNAGIALQARLPRTMDDIETLPAGAVVRLCKGIYDGPPGIALADPDGIREAFVAALARLLDRGAFVGIATHDDGLVRAAESLVAGRGLGRDGYEFQMLLGVRTALRARLVDRGHRVRVYVPFGRDWEAYAIRRLSENPRIAGHVLRALVGLG